MPPKKATAAVAAASSSSSAAAKKKASTSKKNKGDVKSSDEGSSNKKKTTTTAKGNKKRKAEDDDEDDKDDSDVAASSSASSSSTKKPASKKVKKPSPSSAAAAAAASVTSSSTSGITFPIKGGNFDWIAAVSKEQDLPTAICIFLAHTQGLSAHILHALQKHAPHIDLKHYKATLNKMVNNGTVIKHNYNPQYGASATNYYLTAQLKCNSCGSTDPEKHNFRKCSNFKECNKSYCDPCRTNRGDMDIIWYCPTCRDADHKCA